MKDLGLPIGNASENLPRSDLRQHHHALEMEYSRACVFRLVCTKANVIHSFISNRQEQTPPSTMIVQLFVCISQQ